MRSFGLGSIASGLAGRWFRVSAIFKTSLFNVPFYWGLIGIFAFLLVVMCSNGLISVDFEHDAPTPFQNNEFESVLIAIIACAFSGWAPGLLGLRRREGATRWPQEQNRNCHSYCSSDTDYESARKQNISDYL